jgi:translocator protein
MVKFIISLGAAFAAATIGALATGPATPTWYAGLRKPVFAPPNWLFGPAWAVLYILMAVAAFLVWREGFASKVVKLALAAYLVQLVLNAIWSVLFFGLRSPLAGLVGIIVLLGAIAVTIVLFLRVSVLAGVLMLPYIGWVSFATALNAAILKLNR